MPDWDNIYYCGHFSNFIASSWLLRNWRRMSYFICMSDYTILYPVLCHNFHSMILLWSYQYHIFVSYLNSYIYNRSFLCHSLTHPIFLIYMYVNLKLPSIFWYTFRSKLLMHVPIHILMDVLIRIINARYHIFLINFPIKIINTAICRPFLSLFSVTTLIAMVSGKWTCCRFKIKLN